MEISEGLEGLAKLPAGATLSIGNFDGVHRGHRHIVQTCRALADGRPGSSVAIATFEPHPFTVLRPEQTPPRLTPLQTKRELLRQAGVDHLIVLKPEPAVLNTSAEDFFHLLRDRARIAHLVEGASFRFGQARAGTMDKLRAWAADTSVNIVVADAVKIALLDLSVLRVSSSLIRWLLSNGRVRDAAICLGRPYALIGPVVGGFRRGRTIGIPTANLAIADQLVPADGVYAGRCTIDAITYPAAISIGTLPTFDEATRQIEAHLIGFSGDLYGKTIALELIDWLRDQRRFAGVQELKRQMSRDLSATAERSRIDPSLPLTQI